MQESMIQKKHTVYAENRELLELEGVNDVGAFNEEEITARCDCGSILIKGNGLHIEVLDLDSGKLKIKGKVTALVYSDSVSTKGLLGRLFS
ncbi:MAG: sporulation protein YabP [Eubacterium sp.]|nr:sporulation protein YabP [Eubacterium sp.]